MCKNNCNTSDRLATQAVQNCSRLEKKPDINMSLPSSYAGDPLKLELEEVKLERLDGNVKMIPEVKDNLSKWTAIKLITWSIFVFLIILIVISPG